MRCVLMLCVILATGCTPGSFATPNSNGSNGAITVIDVNLTNDPAGQTSAGSAGGYKPLSATVSLGTQLRFTNSDGFAHTASSISGSTFPAAYPFNNSALTQSGATLSGGFTSGNLGAGTSSQLVLADVAGTYLYGCFYHYGTPMRAQIVVR